MNFLISFILHYPFLIAMIIFIILLNLKTRKTKNNSGNNGKSFWEIEAAANATRKKDLSNLHYITIPEKSLPFIETNDEIIDSCQEDIKALAAKKIVNFTGRTNTELKLEYGAANLTALMEYDSNFTDLCRLLNKWGQRLLELGYTDKACIVFEYAVSIMSDISNTYKQLGSIYMKNGSPEKIDSLLKNAGSLNSMSKNVILKHLEELKNSSIS